MEKHHITNSGLDVYFYETPGLKKFCISLYIKAGILYEGEHETGTTHYLEHMLFRRMAGFRQESLTVSLTGWGLIFQGRRLRIICGWK